MTTQLLHPKVDPFIQARKILTDWYYKKYPSDDCFVPHLEHWLAVLGEKNIVLMDIVTGGDIAKASIGETYITFYLTTGQPANELDYKLFNDITRA